MKVLLIKMSSFGDVLHTLPAIQDAFRAKQITFDWAIEPSFSDMASLNMAVKEVIPVPLRYWRKNMWSSLKSGDVKRTLSRLRSKRYDLVIDAQGLLKSALVGAVTKGQRVGYNKHSIREPLASSFYHRKVEVSRHLHAVERTRALFADIFGYQYQTLPLDYGIDPSLLPKKAAPSESLLFLHGTTWDTKHWPQTYWQQLTEKAAKQGYTVLLPWGSEAERKRALAIKESCTLIPQPQVLPKMSLLELAGLMLSVDGVVAVDTGLGHLASALGVTCLSLYGSTDPKRTGTHGLNQAHLQAIKSCAPCLKRTCQLEGSFEVNPPCFLDIHPQRVWSFLQPMLEQKSTRKMA